MTQVQIMHHISSDQDCQIIKYLYDCHQQNDERPFLTDVDIVCSDGIVPVHSVVLTSGSSILRKCFHGLSASQREHVVIHFPDHQTHDVILVMQCLYTGNCIVPNNNEVNRVYEVMNNLGISKDQFQLCVATPDDLSDQCHIRPVTDDAEIFNIFDIGQMDQILPTPESEIGQLYQSLLTPESDSFQFSPVPVDHLTSNNNDNKNNCPQGMSTGKVNDDDTFDAEHHPATVDSGDQETEVEDVPIFDGGDQGKSTCDNNTSATKNSAKRPAIRISLRSRRLRKRAKQSDHSSRHLVLPASSSDSDDPTYHPSRDQFEDNLDLNHPPPPPPESVNQNDRTAENNNNLAASRTQQSHRSRRFGLTRHKSPNILERRGQPKNSVSLLKNQQKIHHVPSEPESDTNSEEDSTIDDSERLKLSEPIVLLDRLTKKEINKHCVKNKVPASLSISAENSRVNSTASSDIIMNGETMSKQVEKEKMGKDTSQDQLRSESFDQNSNLSSITLDDSISLNNGSGSAEDLLLLLTTEPPPLPMSEEVPEITNLLPSLNSPDIGQPIAVHSPHQPDATMTTSSTVRSPPAPKDHVDTSLSSPKSDSLSILARVMSNVLQKQRAAAKSTSLSSSTSLQNSTSMDSNTCASSSPPGSEFSVQMPLAVNTVVVTGQSTVTSEGQPAGPHKTSRPNPNRYSGVLQFLHRRSSASSQSPDRPVVCGEESTLPSNNNKDPQQQYNNHNNGSPGLACRYVQGVILCEKCDQQFSTDASFQGHLCLD